MYSALNNVALQVNKKDYGNFLGAKTAASAFVLARVDVCLGAHR